MRLLASGLPVSDKEPSLLFLRLHTATADKFPVFVIGIDNRAFMIPEVEKGAINLFFSGFHLLTKLSCLILRRVDPVFKTGLHFLQFFLQLKHLDTIAGKRLSLDIQLLVGQVF